MPRIAKSEHERIDSDLRATIKAELARNDMTVKSFVKRCGFTYATFRRRYTEPDSFTRGEIYTMANVLNISAKRLLNIEP